MERHPTKREVLRQFISAYRDFVELWDTTHKNYNNRIRKSDSYTKLVDILRLLDPNATRETVVKQINSLRSNFRKELGKIQKKALAGEKYVPTLWYYDDFLFLVDKNYTAKRKAPPLRMEDFKVGKREEESSCSSIINYESSAAYEYVEVPSQELPSPQQERESNTCEEQNKQLLSFRSALKSSLNSTINNSSASQNPFVAMRVEDEDDEYLLLAKNYAMKLKKMEPLQRLFADRIINEVLLDGQLGTLNRYTSISRPATKDNDNAHPCLRRWNESMVPSGL